MRWQTTFGAVEVEEALWRLGRRGKRWRPFCQQAGVRPRGCSRRLQRVLVDFGAEQSFGRAAQRVQEHYGIEAPVQRVRRQTLSHGAEMSGLEMPKPKQAAKALVTEMDGSLIPVVVTQEKGKDRRKGKELIWREVRLCLAREAESVTPRYGATLGSVEVAGMVWRQTAEAAGLGPQSRVHGLGDGARWIMEQFGECFGSQGKYHTGVVPRQMAAGDFDTEQSRLPQALKQGFGGLKRSP